MEYLIETTHLGKRYGNVEALHDVSFQVRRCLLYTSPAFYCDWFFHRLEKGYSAWTNPFNGVKSYVAYDQTRFIVFWSKNPHPLLKYLPKLKERGIGCYVQYSLNDYAVSYTHLDVYKRQPF